MNKSNKPFPFYLIALLTIFIAFLAWSARQAATDGARITDRDYYSKGLRYNASRIEREAARSLGWEITTELSGRTILLGVYDRQETPLRAAQVTMTLLVPGEPRQLLMQEHSAGLYRVVIPSSYSGEIPARYTIQYQGAQLERNLLINLSLQEKS